MPDITLTITLDEDDARRAASFWEPTRGTPSGIDVTQVTQRVIGAIAAALPPEPPKEGEVWRKDEGRTYEIGPIKWGVALLKRRELEDGYAWDRVAVIAENWAKVR